tara:strand:- start:179 stop:814 length:636 start_codon:yes stop_codon:yes gene_type:complete
MIRMTWKQFEDKYQFETDENGSDLVEIDSDRVKEIEAKHGDNAWRYIWTVCCEGSDEYFVAGYARVNRMNYMTAKIPHDLEDGESVEIVEDYAELSRRPKNELVVSAEPKLNIHYHYAKFDLRIDNELKIVEIFAEEDVYDGIWFSLAIDGEVMETSQYSEWNPDDEDEKGEFNFDELIKTELMGNRYLGRDIITDTFIRQIIYRHSRCIY